MHSKGAPEELSRLDMKNWTPTPALLQGLLIGKLQEAAADANAVIVLDQVDVPETGVITRRLLEALKALVKDDPHLLVLADSRRSLRGFPPLAAGAARIRVTFQVDADGLLAVTARESTSGVEATVSVKPSYGLSDEEVARLLQESMGAADSDMRERALREQQVDGKRLLAAVRAALAADPDLLGVEERTTIEARMRALEHLIGGRDAQPLREALEALSRATDEFAARRMDRSIRVALSGKRVDELTK